MPNVAKKAPESTPVRVAKIGMIAAIATAIIAALAPSVKNVIDPPPPTLQNDRVFVVRVIDSRTNHKIELADVSLSIGDTPYSKPTGSDGAASFPIPQSGIGQMAYLRVEKEGYKAFSQQLRVSLEEKVVQLEPFPQAP